MRIATVLGGEILLLAGASMAHAGLLPVTQPHARAAIAEAVIAFALALGLAACLIRPDVTRPAALASQAFALLGTLVGGLTILIGVGPQTIEDKAFHILLLAILAFGLIDAAGLRVPPKGTGTK